MPDGFILDAAPNLGLSQQRGSFAQPKATPPAGGSSPKGNPFDAFDAPASANPFDVFDTPALANPFDAFDAPAAAAENIPSLPDGFTLDSDPSVSNPAGTALGRALKRGVLRTRSTLPAIQAQKGATVLADAALAESDLIRNVFLETTRLPDVPEGVDISTPELASAAIAQMGYPADFANVFRQTYDIRARDAGAAIGNEADVAQRAIENVQAAQGLNDRAAALPGSASAEQFKQVLSAAPDTTLDVLKAYAQNPGTALAFLGETAAESLPQMGASAATTLATRSPALGAAVLGGGTLTQEFGSSVSEFFREHGVSPKTPEEAAALIRNPDLMAAASRRGVGRGVVIALAEMAGQGVAAKQLFKGPVKEATKDVTAQMVAGGGGEALARAATGQDMSAREIITEALAEGIATPVEVGATVYQSRKNKKLAEQQPVVVTEQIPALPSGYVLDSERTRQDGTSDVEPASAPSVIPGEPRPVQAVGHGETIQGQASAGQLRTSDVQPLAAPTKVPDTTRREEPTLGTDTVQAPVPRLGYEGRLALQERIKSVSNANDSAVLQRQWFEDVRREVSERASHPQFEKLERRTSTKQMQENLNELQAAMSATEPDLMFVEDRMNRLELDLATDRRDTASNREERHSTKLATYAAHRKLLEHRLTNPAFGAPEVKNPTARYLQVIKALERAEKDPHKRAELEQINADMKRKLDAIDAEFGVKPKPRN